jgi:hypothetical protein
MRIEIPIKLTAAVESGCSARAIGAAIVTEADSIDELREAVRDAVRCHVEDADRRKVIRLHLVREEIITRSRLVFVGYSEESYASPSGCINSHFSPMPNRGVFVAVNDESLV